MSLYKQIYDQIEKNLAFDVGLPNGSRIIGRYDERVRQYQVTFGRGAAPSLVYCYTYKCWFWDRYTLLERRAADARMDVLEHLRAQGDDITPLSSTVFLRLLQEGTPAIDWLGFPKP